MAIIKKSLISSGQAPKRTTVTGNISCFSCLREVGHRQAQHSQAEHREAQHREAEYGQAEHRKAEYGKAQHGQAEHREAEYGKAQHGQAEHREAEYRQADHSDGGALLTNWTRVPADSNPVPCVDAGAISARSIGPVSGHRSMPIRSASGLADAARRRRSEQAWFSKRLPQLLALPQVSGPSPSSPGMSAHEIGDHPDRARCKAMAPAEEVVPPRPRHPVRVYWRMKGTASGRSRRAASASPYTFPR